MTNHHLLAAHRFAEFGRPVFPLVPFEKVPLYGSDGFREATTDSRQIEKWWARNPDRNIGIATGARSFDVLDIDTGKGRGPSGYKALNELKRSGLIPQHLAAVRTPSGGLHLMFKGTEQTSGRLPKHSIDYRAENGYVVAPPSVVGGKPYEVIDKHPVLGAGELDWAKVIAHLEPQRETRQHSLRSFPGRDADPDRLAAWLSRMPEGERNFPLFWAAARLAEAGKLDSAARGKLLEASRANGLRGGDREANRTIDSAIRNVEHGGAPRQSRAPEKDCEPEERKSAPAESEAHPEPKRRVIQLRAPAVHDQEPAAERVAIDAERKLEEPVPFQEAPEREGAE